jgi:hypothetical protein
VTEMIICDGKEKHVTVNLANALRAIHRNWAAPSRIIVGHTMWKKVLMRTEQTMLLWVDASCIDQIANMC